MEIPKETFATSTKSYAIEVEDGILPRPRVLGYFRALDFDPAVSRG